VASTHVIISTVGPFINYGENVVRAAVECGTHYCDSTGEVAFVADMIEKYESKAKETGAKLISMSAFDSIPADLGTLFAVTELKAKLNSQDVDIVSDFGTVIPVKSGGGIGASGGTLHSAFAMVDKGRDAVKKMLDPYALVPQPDRAELQQKSNKADKDIMIPHYDKNVGKWEAPWAMAVINTRVVHRSAALYRRAGFAYSKKTPFSYNEALGVPYFVIAAVIAVVMAFVGIFIALPPTRAVLRRVVPSAGTGPTAKQRSKTILEYEHVATAATGEKLHATFTCVDPGYGNTGVMLAETAFLLLEDVKNPPKGSGVIMKNGKPHGLATAGFLTPATAFGYRLIDRLNEANTGLTLKYKSFSRK